MSFVSYDDVTTGLHAAFATIDNLAQFNGDGECTTILAYEPEGDVTTPCVYSLLASFRRENKGQITVMRYRTLHRVLLQWQVSKVAEQELRSFVHAIPAAIDANPTLGGRITLGVAQCSDGETGFVVISSVKYRCIDFYSDVPTKAPYRSGI